MSKKIALTNGNFSLVDLEDYNKIIQFNWYQDKNGYAYRKTYLGNKKYKNLFLHRFILNEPKHKDVDHINHNVLDNRKINLRLCNHNENVKNVIKHRDGKSKYKGICFHKNRRKPYQAKLMHNGKYVSGGYFLIEIDAAKAYNKLAKEYHGEFCFLNKI